MVRRLYHRRVATLYHYHDCPLCFRLRAYLYERELPFVSHLVDRDAPPPELLSLSPLGRLPLWVTDDGKPLFGAQTIAHYLEAVHGSALWPTEPLPRARASMAEEMAWEGLVQPLAKLDREHAGRGPEAWNLEVWQIETRRVRRTLQVFEALLGGREWLLGQAISVADLALAHPLAVLERYGIDLQDFPGLANLAERLGKRPSVVAARAAPKRTAA